MGYSPPSNGAYAQNAIMTIYPQYLDESAYDDEAYDDAAFANFDKRHVSGYEDEPKCFGGHFIIVKRHRTCRL